LYKPPFEKKASLFASHNHCTCFTLTLQLKYYNISPEMATVENIVIYSFNFHVSRILAINKMLAISVLPTRFQ